MISLTTLSLQVILEVCAERTVGRELSCVTLEIDDCQSRWEGEGDSRVWVNISQVSLYYFEKYHNPGHHTRLLCQAASPEV